MKQIPQKKVSVIIPVRNGERTLRACLESVLHQTQTPHEIICVDNGSIDNTKRILEEYPNILYIHEEKKGRGRARNTGIHASTGDIIVMTDADCVVPSDWIEKITKPIQESGERIVMGPAYDLIQNYWTQQIQKKESAALEKSSHKDYIKTLDTKNVAFERNLLEQYAFNESMCSLEDFELSIRLQKDSRRVYFERENIVGHAHKSSFCDVVRINIDRAYWTKRILTLHQEESWVKKLLAEHLSLWRFLSFPIWIFVQFFKRPLADVFFLLVSEAAWKYGLLLRKPPCKK